MKMIRGLKSIRLPSYLKAKYLTIGLIVGAVWGFLSTAVFVTVGMFGDESHPYHWLFQIFQNSVHMLWFKTTFLPFLLSLEAGYMFAFFGSTPVGAVIGMFIGAGASVLNYILQNQQN